MAQGIILENNIDITNEWIVHAHFGIGQIEGVDEKEISGANSRYYRIKTQNSTFWIPVGDMDDELLRPLSTPEDIQQAIAILQTPPKRMSSSATVRHSKIRKTRQQNSPQAMAQLIRDLRGLQREKEILNQTERSALQKLKQRLAEEWALVLGIKAELAISKMDALVG